MKRLMSVMCVACVLGVGASVAAQRGADPMDKTAMMKDGQMNVSGCVAAGKTPGQFMLTNAMTMGGTMSKDMNKPAMGGAHMMSYELVGGTIAPHMGHKIEVMGTMSKMDMDHMAKMDKMDQAAKDKMMADKTMAAMKLNVTSVKMVAATCP